MLTNADLLDRFEREHLARHSVSPGRRKRSATVLLSVAATLGERKLVEMTASDLMAWQGAQLDRGIKPNTIRNWETMIGAFLTWALAAELISFERSAQLKSVTAVRGSRVQRPKPYKRADIEALREALERKYPLAPAAGRGSEMVKRFLCGESELRRSAYKHARRLQLEAQIGLALEEGLRCIEVWSSTIPQIHYDNIGVVVLTAKQEPGAEREREVPYTAHSRLCVQEWLDFRSLMAPGHGSPWLSLTASDPRGAQPFRTFEESLQLLGRPYFNWHRLRHTFATERLRAGMPLEQLQIMLGHANLSQTLAYAQIVSSDVRSEADRTEGQFARNLGLAA